MPSLGVTQHGGPRYNILTSRLEVNRNSACSSPCNPIHRFRIFNVTAILNASAGTLPSHGRQVPITPQVTLTENATTGAKMRLEWRSVKNWSFGEFLEGPSIKRNRQSDRIAERNGNAQVPADVPEQATIAVARQPRRHCTAIVECSQLSRSDHWLPCQLKDLVGSLQIHHQGSSDTAVGRVSGAEVNPEKIPVQVFCDRHSGVAKHPGKLSVGPEGQPQLAPVPCHNTDLVIPQSFPISFATLYSASESARSLARCRGPPAQRPQAAGHQRLRHIANPRLYDPGA